ncbi:hypothetical protein BDV93DRAFT_524582 [Ceratobasidium sp. AG-I]|nr:hypothetical protein BDV93DRAFT_524582 [Ceratobasidium sp. AG-I]
MPPNAAKSKSTTQRTRSNGSDRDFEAPPERKVVWSRDAKRVMVIEPNGEKLKWTRIDPPEHPDSCNLVRTMEMDRVLDGEDKYQVYLNIRNCARLGLKAQLLGATNVLWKHLSLEAKMHVSNLTLSQFAILNRFPGNWAVFEIMKRILRNSRDTKTGRKGRKSGANGPGLPASAPAQVSAPAQQAVDDDDDFPTSNVNHAGPSGHAAPSGSTVPAATTIPVALADDDDDDDDDDDNDSDDNNNNDWGVKQANDQDEDDKEEDEEEEDEEEEDEPVVKRTGKGKGKQRVLDSDDEAVFQPPARPPPSPPSPPTTLGRSDGPSSPIQGLSIPGTSNTKKRKVVADPDALPVEGANKRAKVATPLGREDSWRAGYERELAELAAAEPKPKKARKKAAKASVIPVPTSSASTPAPSAPNAASTLAAGPVPTAVATAATAPAPKKATRKPAKTTAAPAPTPSASADSPSAVAPIAAVAPKSKGRARKTADKLTVASASVSALLTTTTTGTPAPAPVTTRPRPKMRPIPPIEDTAATVTTQAAKAELIDQVDASATSGRRSTRRKPAGSN